MNSHRKGFSLIELITTISISTILLTVGAPSLAELSDQIRADTNIKTIQQTLQFARNTAVSYGYRVTVCPLVNGKCTQDWQKGLTIFIDTGVVESFDANDKIIRVIDEFDSKDFLTYNKSSIKFQPDGLASGSNGTFKYCPRTIDSKNSRAIVVNQAGRVRLSTAKNINCD